MPAERRNPEELKAAINIKEQAKAAALTAKKEAAGIVHFVADGKVYVPVLKKVIIPRLGERTALEICADKEAQAYLLLHGEGVIREVNGE